MLKTSTYGCNIQVFTYFWPCSVHKMQPLFRLYMFRDAKLANTDNLKNSILFCQINEYINTKIYHAKFRHYDSILYNMENECSFSQDLHLKARSHQG